MAAVVSTMVMPTVVTMVSMMVAPTVMWESPTMMVVTAHWAANANTIISGIRAVKTWSTRGISIATILTHVTVAWVRRAAH